MQPVIKQFAKDLKAEIRRSRFSKKIMSVVLLGSAARGEWVRGESDIDMIVVVRSKEDKKGAARFIGGLLGKLNKKHTLRLEKTCTDEKKYGNEVLNAILKLESAVFFGVPFYVISYDEYDFMRNRISSPRIWFLATFLGSLNSFLLNVKDTAKTIYGKDLLKGISVRLHFSDKLKIYLEQAYILLAACLILLFDRKLAIKHAVKASLYQEEFDLMLLHKHLRGYGKDRRAFERAFSGNRFAVSHLRKSLQHRKNFNKLNPGTDEVVKYIISTTKFVFGR